ncbi:hypothetical protein DFH09DRAFT_1076451 [Mycena vulgaris]|nr:hypothetical protein DFH09DRAFT_1076451 [Mycena vulgaris]
MAGSMKQDVATFGNEPGKLRINCMLEASPSSWVDIPRCHYCIEMSRSRSVMNPSWRRDRHNELVNREKAMYIVWLYVIELDQESTMAMGPTLEKKQKHRKQQSQSFQARFDRTKHSIGVWGTCSEKIARKRHEVAAELSPSSIAPAKQQHEVEYNRTSGEIDNNPRKLGIL